MSISMRTSERQNNTNRQIIEAECPHCHHRGSDVGFKQEWVGGIGYVKALGCLNEVACWERWDRAHGFPKWDAVGQRWISDE